MTVKTENLAILFTDIAGFTEATSKQSRAENEQVLSRHNSILLPIVRSFKGRHVKSIGDALLLTFRSPTDAMLCAMAMQDALHEYNQTVSEREAIHIRIAASLGEVRVTKNDIFGEPVNVTSRIEGITPADEIYLSEAIYLAMNKAEVPTQEVGREELKGIANDVRIYCIPRFASLRLVSDTADQREVTGGRGLSYPFGGAHLNAIASSAEGAMAQWKTKRWMVVPLAASFFTLAMVIALQRKQSVDTTSSLQNDWATVERQELVVDGSVATPGITPPSTETTTTASSTASTTTPISPQQAATSLVPITQSHPAQTEQTTVVAPIPIASAIATPVATLTASDIPAIALKVNSAKKTPSVAPKISPGSGTATTSPVKKPVKPSYTRFSQLKIAYRAGQITRDYYETRYRQLKIDRDQRIRALKTAYNEGRMSKVTYKERYRQLVLSYE